MIAALVLAPIFIGLALFALPASRDRLVRALGIVVSVVVLIATLISHDAPDVSVPWLSRPFTAAFHFGYGPLSYWLVLLLAAAMVSALLAMRMPRAREFTAHMLVLQGAMNGLFLARDLLVFALFWDLMLIPVFLLMIGYGSAQRGSRSRGSAAWRYLIYNVVGGLALLLATAAFGVVHGSTDVIGAPSGSVIIGSEWGAWILGGFALAFAIKTPLWPFHAWMPDTYAELPPPVVAIVSGVQSKAGIYGLIVIALPFLNESMHRFAPYATVLGLIALLYGALLALTQSDAKRIVAYSSLSHLGLMVVGVFSFNPLAIAGTAVYMIAHGLFSAALFLVLGFVEMREETRLLPRLGGLGSHNPRLAGALLIASLAALGLPGLAGFAGEILILTGVFAAGAWGVVLIALVPVVLAAAYMLRVFQGTMNGPVVADLPERRDLTWREGMALVPLVVGVVWLGVDPHSIVGAIVAGLH